MKCPGCNKFAAYDTSADPELDLDANEGQVTGTARIVLTSECCGEELKEASFDVEIDLTEEFQQGIRSALELADDAKIDFDGWEFEMAEESASLTDRMETEKVRVKKDGTEVRRQIPPRYQRRYFGVCVEVKVRATKGKTKVEVDGSYEDEIPAGSMDELV